MSNNDTLRATLSRVRDFLVDHARASPTSIADAARLDECADEIARVLRETEVAPAAIAGSAYRPTLLTPSSNPTYDLDEGRIIDRGTGEMIPDDEPVFILRGEDACAEKTLVYYFHHLGQDVEMVHLTAVAESVRDFADFRLRHPHRMKAHCATLSSDTPAPGGDPAGVANAAPRVDRSGGWDQTSDDENLDQTQQGEGE